MARASAVGDTCTCPLCPAFFTPSTPLTHPPARPHIPICAEVRAKIIARTKEAMQRPEVLAKVRAYRPPPLTEETKVWG